MGAVVGVDALSCSAESRVLVVISNILLRGVFQYLAAVQYIFLARHFAHAEVLRERIISLYGQLTSWVTIIASFAAFMLTTDGTLHCSLADNVNETALFARPHFRDMWQHRVVGGPPPSA